MKALDAYRAVLHELDKFSTPTFESEQFNHFFNMAIDDYIANNYARYPLTQKDTDDIRTLVKSTPSPLAITAKRVALPEDYRHVLKVSVVGTVIAKQGKYTAGQSLTLKRVERRFSNEEGYREDNAYLKASIKSPYFELEGDDMVFDMGDNFTPGTTSLQYIKIPPTIVLASDEDTFDENDEAMNSTLPFPLHVNKELVTLCARKFLENIESKRYATKLNEDRLKAQ